jgi:hypothetical protein
LRKLRFADLRKFEGGGGHSKNPGEGTSVKPRKMGHP